MELNKLYVEKTGNGYQVTYKFICVGNVNTDVYTFNSLDELKKTLATFHRDVEKINLTTETL